MMTNDNSKAAVATSASALARDEASVAPIRAPLQDSGEPNVWPVPLEIETNYEIGQTVELIFEDDADAERFSRLYSQHMGTAVPPAASSAATVSDAACVLTDDQRKALTAALAWVPNGCIEVKAQLNRLLATSQAATTARAQDERAALMCKRLRNMELNTCNEAADMIERFARAASSATAPLTSDSDVQWEAHLFEVVEHTIETLDRQIQLIAERAPGNYLDKLPVVRSLKAHKQRLERAVAERNASFAGSAQSTNG